MQDFKISLITVTYNAASTIKRCVESVISQNYANIEYIIIDGGSSDDTLAIISQYKHYISLIISEPDNGIYDAMNKGISLATGNVVGTLNADDFFADDHVLENIASAFTRHNPDILYSNLHYINPAGAVIRNWKSGGYKQGSFNWGWMPPHPTFYCKRLLFNGINGYDLNYGSAADYELMLRFMHRRNLAVYYLNMVTIKMTLGGVSNSSLANRVKAWGFDYRAMKHNKIISPLIAIFFKPIRKIIQYF